MEELVQDDITGRRPVALSILHVQRWTPLEVSSWLRAVGLGQFSEHFATHNVGGDILFDITNDDLKEMGVALIGERRRLLRAIRDLHEEAEAGPRPGLDVVVLGASPLVQRSSQGQGIMALEMINIDREQDLLRDAVRASKNFVPGGLQPRFAHGTLQTLSKVFQQGAKILTLTGHSTSEGKMLLETETGEAVEFDPSSMLPNLLGDGVMPVCIVLSSCYSREAGRAFLRFGARHVVAVERTATVLDSAARVFNATFHHALLVGNTVDGAFRFAVAHVRHSSHPGCNEAGKFLLLPDDVPGRHDVALFGARGSIGAPPGSEGTNGLGTYSAHPEMRVVGRQLDTWKVIVALQSFRCVVICGIGGVGKAALCRSVSGYLQERGRRFCAEGVHIVRLRGLCTVHAVRSQLRDVLEEGEIGIPVAGAEPDSLTSERWEQVLGRLGERLLVLTNAEEVLHAAPIDMAQFLQCLLTACPQVRVLLTSRRSLSHKDWPACAIPPPHHHMLRQLEANDSASLLNYMAPTLHSVHVQKIAAVCGHLPLALRVVGQRLAVASDPVAAAADFLAETEHSPERRVSLLFSQCVAPYVWRTLDGHRRSALAALSLLKGSFNLSAASAVLGVSSVKARALLDEFFEECFIELCSEVGTVRNYFMPTSVHLLVQQQYATGVINTELLDGTVTGIDLAGASTRLVFFFLRLLQDVAKGVASDNGKGGAGLEALRVFDRHHADIEAALTLAGNSDLFIIMVQLGRDVFETRLSAQRLVEIYERLLGILMARTPHAAVPAKTDQRSNRIRQLIQRFGESGHSSIVETKSNGLYRTASSPAAPMRQGRQCAQTVPCTPVHPRTPSSKRCSLSDVEPDADDDEISEGAPSRITSGSSLLEQALPSLRRRHMHTAASLSLGPADVQPSSGISEDVAVAKKDEQEATEHEQSCCPPSFVFAADSDATTAATDAGNAEAMDPMGAAALSSHRMSRPSWCRPLTADQNPWLRQQLADLLPPTPSCGSHEMGDESPPACAGTEAASKWGGWRVRWHEQDAHDEVLVEVLLRLGLAYNSLGRFAHAAQLLRKALMRVEEMVQRGSCPGLCAEHMRAELLGTLSGVLCQQGFREDAEAMLWQARQLAKHTGESSALYIKITCELAEFNHKFKGNLKAAHHLFKQGLDKRIQTLGYDHLDTAYSLNQLGVFSAQRGELEEAKKLIIQAIRIRRRLVGNSHLSVAEAYHNLAGVEENLKNFREAAQLYETALQIKKKALPEYHVSIADTQNNLSIVYSNLKMHEECVRLLRQTLEQCLRTVGETNLSTASVLMNLGHALHCLATANRDRAENSYAWYKAQLDESLSLLERSVAAKKALVHKHHPSMALLRANLGFALYKMEDKKAYAKALHHFSAAVRISQKHYGAVHPDVARWKFWVGKTHIRNDEVSKGRETLREALKIFAEFSSSTGLRAFNTEQLEEIHLLLGESQEELSMSDSAAEPAAEPPSAESEAADRSLSLPIRKRHHEPSWRSPQLDLSLLTQPDDLTSPDEASEGHMSWCNSSSPSSFSNDSGSGKLC